MSIVTRVTDRLISDAIEAALRDGGPVPVSDIADEIMGAVGLSPATRPDLIQRISAAGVAKGLILELKNTSNRTLPPRRE